MSGGESGHVFVVAGDITKISCDAWLLPTDDRFSISDSFSEVVGVEAHTSLSNHTWGDARVVKLKRRRRALGPTIWLGNVGLAEHGDGAKKRAGRWYGSIVDEFVVAARKDLALPTGGRRPSLAVNVLGTGRGGSRSNKGVVNRALISALYVAAERHNVDLTLVCWRRRAYAAAQRQRQRFLADRGKAIEEAWDLGETSAQLRDVAEELAGYVRRRELVLFFGAGASMDAGLPGWQRLLDGLAAKVEPPIDAAELRKLDFRDQAELLQRRSTSKGLHQRIAHLLRGSSYSMVHAQLASLPVAEAVTTNYDALFEMAVTPVDGSPAVLPFQPVERGQRWLLKLHGSLDVGDSIVLTRNDYLGVPARHGALFGLVQAMLLTRHMLFVGYSLSDEDFHQLMFEVRMAQGAESDHRFGTVLTLFEDPLFTELWSDDVRVVPLAQRIPEDASAEERERGVEVAARRLRILLDLVAYLAADLDEFLLDPTYHSLMSDDEKLLAQDLKQLAKHVAKIDEADAPVVVRIRKLLGHLGATEHAEEA